MAKKRQIQMTSQLHGRVKPYTKSAGIVTAPEPVVEMPPKTTPEAVPTTVVIELPLGDVGKDEYLSRHVESRLKTRQQQLAMKRLIRGLQAAGATTQDGRPVQRLGEAVRWVLEQISDSD